MPLHDTEFYTDLRRHVAKAVARVCPSWLSAERDDIIQVAMMRLHHVIERSEGQGLTASSYIWRTAFSVTVDEIRRRGRRPETPLEEAEGAVVAPDRGPDPEQRVMARELGQGIRLCLAGLVDQRRSAVVLYLQGHAVPQIAALLSWNAKKAENLVYRGLSDLRACLTAKGMKST